MSNIIESLKSAVRSQTQESVKKRSDYELTQEELANIYFSSSQKQRNPELPIIVKVIEKQGVASAVPWIITSIAFLITAFSLFSTKRVFVDIKVIDEKNPYFSTTQFSPQAWPQQPVQNAVEEPAAKTEKELFGHPEKILLERVSFDGASKLNSTFDRATMTLINSSVSPFARATLQFETPMNLRGGKIVFYAKGAKGGENLGVALKDRGNVLAFDKGKVNPFPRKLITEWQRAEVLLKDTLPAFDPTQVSTLRFEFGSNNQNKPGDTIFIKEIQVVPGQS